MNPITNLRDKLLFEREFAGRDHEKDIVEGDIFKGIQEGWQQYLGQHLEQCP